MIEKTEEIGPPRISFATFLLKILAGGFGGMAGSLILLLIFVLASSVLTPLTEAADATEYISPVFIFILMVMIFLSSTIGNIISTWLLSLTERDKYTRVSSAIYQVFIISVIIFILTAPVYFLAVNIDTSIIAYAVALHVIVSAQVSALILEVVSNYKYSLVGIYGITFGVLISAMILFALSNVVPSTTILLFIALPTVWGSIAVIHSLTTMLYGWIARTYDKDFLSTQTVYGSDYGNEVENSDEEKPQAEDEEGADFLRHN